MELVHGPAAGADDRVSRHGRSVPPYHGGTSWVARDLVSGHPTWTASWAGRNRCGPKPIESAVAADVTRPGYPDCADDADVVLYTIEAADIPGRAAGRCRSGSRKTRTSIDASD